MRIVFVDVQTINFLVRPYRQIKEGNTIVTYKHKYIIDYAVEKNIEICNFLTMKKSSRRGFKYIKNTPLAKKMVLNEFKFVMNNSFDTPLPIKPIVDSNEIHESDLIIAYLCDPAQLSAIKKLKGIKVLMGNHFIAINNSIDLDEYGVKAFVNEINLFDNAFVKRYIFGKNIEYIKAPYIYAERFINQEKERKNKAMAIGTLSTCSGSSGYKLYREFAGTEWIQPLRKMIFDNKEELIEEIDSYISYIYEDKIPINPADNFMLKGYKRLRNKGIGWAQKRYMSFNMVDKFNEYKMFLCPEEGIGMPGIGFVEGMACGTAYIGLDTAYYRDLGLEPGKNYITYDGTLDNLKEVIHYYQKHNEELEIIAKAGTEFIRDNFNAKVVSENLFREFDRLTREV